MNFIRSAHSFDKGSDFIKSEYDLLKSHKTPFGSLATALLTFAAVVLDVGFQLTVVLVLH